MTGRLKPLPPGALYTPCDPADFPFATTAEIDPVEDVIGQDRAVAAVRFAIGMKHHGFNLFAMGPEGTGKYSLIRRFLELRAAGEPVPDDWGYVNNFDEPHRPRALRLPPGRAAPLAADMDRLVEELRAAIPAAFESDAYRAQRAVIDQRFKQRHEEAFGGLHERAQSQGIALVRTQAGLVLAPVADGEVLEPQDFAKLPKDEQERRTQAMADLQKELEAHLAEIPKWEKAQRQEIRKLNRQVTRQAVDHLIEEAKRPWTGLPAVLDHLEAVRRDVVENVRDFLSFEQAPEAAAQGRPPSKIEADPYRRYHVNVLVDNTCPSPVDEAEGRSDHGPACVDGRLAGAPVVYEDHPTLPNLIGRVEHLSEFGTLVTDFNLIKAGALHRANGGYLILDARKLLTQPFAWETLKRALRSRRLRIESPGEAGGLLGTVTLEPEPIPLDVKVVLLGEPQLYYVLTESDPEAGELFKVVADFDNRMDRSTGSALQYAKLIATLARRENLKSLDRGAMARVVEHGARLAGDAEKLSTHMGSIVDLVREADFWAGEEGAAVVGAPHVQKAIDARIHRADRVRERIQEEIRRGTLLVETGGERVGQINGLAVLQMHDFAFGRPSRISCRVRLGKGQVVDIEREVALGGPLHSKGVLILASYLGTRFAREMPLSLSASLVFEQSYSGVDGDSASSAELYALLSALSEIPIRQGWAVTGSVDQHGRVQAIGGVNEKIEGFFDVCRARGLTGRQGVLIPAANVRHLMLRRDVVEAVAAKSFRIYAVETVDQGIEILTGVPAGEADAKGGFPIGSVNRAVVRGLERLARLERKSEEKRLPGRRSGRRDPRED
ncbi:Lon protease family protein [Shumkonia mesophila]|uniref:Lon protease family protein n=1 Tax=Shumkonia mesophila TaxID=2838854 RepID=UPI002934D068|nr:ATP-binding protein [Shumkonia mesophila]